MRSNLYYYRNKAEFDQYYVENSQNVVGAEILDPSIYNEKIINSIIDITDLILYVNIEKMYRYSIRLGLKKLDESNKLIIHKDFVDTAMNVFPLLFEKAIPIYDKDEGRSKLKKNIRHKIYYYNSKELNKIENECNKREIILTNFAGVQKFNNYENDLMIDITNTLYTFKGAEHIIYLLEQFFSTMSEKVTIIVDVQKLDDVKKYLRLTFSEYVDISKLFENITPATLEKEENEKLKRIIDLKDEEMNNLFFNIDTKLIGHKKFKDELKNKLKKFLQINKIGRQKIFSMFLLGQPGLGKTEIGKIISKTINPNSKIIKINFGNYSSQDALNSLIGSPAGYIGCDGGELSKKVSNNSVGVVICDEFEKADSEIKNFFLELLEDGKFTDSMSREYDLNGYIIIFTSNIKNVSDFDSKMSPEFKSRINLICEFKQLTDKEKIDYINYQIKELKKDIEINSIKHKKIPDNIDIQYKDTNDLRELRDRVYNKILEYID